MAWAMLGAAVVAALSGINTLSNDFTYDDYPIIVQNPAVTGDQGFKAIWGRDYWWHVKGYDPNRDLLYRPLTVSTYRLNHAIGGLRPAGYHAVNLLLHAGVAALVVAAAWGMGCSGWAAATAGLLFAAMPIHTEAVASVVGRAESLAALFTLLAVLLVMRGGPVSRWGTVIWLLGIAAAVLAAMLAKESGVAAAVLAPVFAVAGQTARRPSALRLNAGGDRTGVVRIVAAVMLALVTYLAMRSGALAGQVVRREILSPVTNMMVEATAAERFWGGWQLLGMYVGKTFWPGTLCADYSYKSLALARTPWNASVVVGLATVAVLSVVGARWWRRGERGLAAACLAVVICYLPVSNTLVLMGTLFAERVWYMPSVFAAIVVAGVLALMAPAWRRRAVYPVVICAVAAGLARGWQRNVDWRDNGTLFASAYRVHPNSVAVLHGYGGWLVEHGEMERGLELLERSVAIAPGLVDAQVTLGAAYMRHGQPDRAMAALQAAAMSQAVSPSLRRLMDEARRQAAAAKGGAIAEAKRRYEAEPSDLAALVALSDRLTEVGQIEGALSVLAEAAERFRDRSGFHQTRAVALMLAGRRDEAIEAYRASLRIEGGQVDVLVELGVALMDRRGPGDLAEAGVLIDEAVKLAPDEPRALVARAELYLVQGRTEEAVRVYRGLVERLPASEFREALRARLEALAGR